MPVFTIALKDAIALDPAIVTQSLATYPIFDEAYRPHLNKLITDQYWNQEIGQETISMFRLALRRKMEQIMPLYNQQYEISRIEFDPLQTVNIANVAASTGHSTATTVSTAEGTSTGHSESTGDTTNTSTSDAKSRAVAQELPQTLLSGTGDYATNAQDNVSTTTAGGTGTEAATVDQNGTSNDSSNTTGDVTENGTTTNTTTGFSGNPAMMLMQYRQSLVNVDMMVLDELKELFMLIWANGDTYTGRHPYYGFY